MGIMGMTPRQYFAMVTLVAIISIGSVEVISRVSAEEGAPAKMSRQVWKVEVFVENDDSRVAERLSGKLENHLNNVAKAAAEVKLLLSYKTNGNVVATLVYYLTDTPYHYAVHLHKCPAAANKDDRDEHKADLEKWLNAHSTYGWLTCLVQDAVSDQVLVGAICMME